MDNGYVTLEGAIVPTDCVNVARSWHYSRSPKFDLHFSSVYLLQDPESVIFCHHPGNAIDDDPEGQKRPA